MSENEIQDYIRQNTYWRTRMVNKYKQRLEDYEADDKKEYRQSINECKKCHYLDSGYLAGQAFTKYKCPICEEDKWSPNTHIPSICPECAKELNACTECGGEMD